MVDLVNNINDGERQVLIERGQYYIDSGDAIYVVSDESGQDGGWQLVDISKGRTYEYTSASTVKDFIDLGYNPIEVKRITVE